MAPQDDAMVKPAVALKTGTATAEALRKRFHSSHVTPPPSTALAELGKGEQTLSLCASLSALARRYEVNAGLHGVERWHATHAFLGDGRQGLCAPNRRAQQAISTLGLHLRQHGLRLIHTLLVARTIEAPHLVGQLSEEDRRALPPRFSDHGTPYGVCALDLEHPSCLEAA